MIGVFCWWSFFDWWVGVFFFVLLLIQLSKSKNTRQRVDMTSQLLADKWLLKILQSNRKLIIMNVLVQILTNWKNCGETKGRDNKNWVVFIFVVFEKTKIVDLINQLFSLKSCCGNHTNLDFLLWFDYGVLSKYWISIPQIIFRKLGHVGYEDLNFSVYRG